MQLTSRAFGQDGEIPPRFTCDGADRSPPLEWVNAPPGTESYVLLIEDPDSPGVRPRGNYTHWVLYNIPANARHLEEAVASTGALPKGTKQGLNDWHEPFYGGPCPPTGRHRYVHRLFALDTVLPDLGFPDKATLLRAMEGHILATAELTGTYKQH